MSQPDYSEAEAKLARVYLANRRVSALKSIEEQLIDELADPPSDKKVIVTTTRRGAKTLLPIVQAAIVLLTEHAKAENE